MGCKVSTAVLAVIGVLSAAPSAVGQVVPLVCEHKSGAFEGQVWSAAVDFSTRTVRFGFGDTPNVALPATIDDEFVTVPSYSPERAIRINRITGQMQWS
jgi:hypothetical protein